MKYLLVVMLWLFATVSAAQAQENPYLQGWEDAEYHDESHLEYFICIQLNLFYQKYNHNEYILDHAVEDCTEYARAYFKMLYTQQESNANQNTRKVELLFYDKSRKFAEDLEPLIDKMLVHFEQD